MNAGRGRGRGLSGAGPVGGRGRRRPGERLKTSFSLQRSHRPGRVVPSRLVSPSGSTDFLVKFFVQNGIKQFEKSDLLQFLLGKNQNQNQNQSGPGFLPSEPQSPNTQPWFPPRVVTTAQKRQKECPRWANSTPLRNNPGLTVGSAMFEKADANKLAWKLNLSAWKGTSGLNPALITSITSSLANHVYAFRIF